MSSVRPNLSDETLKAITAWDLRTGRVVYRTREGGWSDTHADADTWRGDAARAALAAAEKDVRTVVGPYFVEVGADGALGGREALREAIRAAGPTTHPHHGKQGGDP